MRKSAYICVIALALWNQVMAAQPQVPDLTRGGRRDGTHDWTLGPTGARGWIWGRDLETTDARQILITKVETGSPAHGLLEEGDVILGVDGKPFDGDARMAFGRAITEAEEEESKGLLKLLRWRKGSRAEVAVPIEVMGSYSDTAPRDCPKSERILQKACRYLAGRKLTKDLVGEVNALGLLASGRPEFLEKVKALAREFGPADLKLELRSGMLAWEWGYANLFLTEYHLATGDRYVLPAIREYSVMIAAGQSAVGTWGHGMALPGNGGRLGGYGAINQSGMVCWLSLVLAQKCGVRDRVVGEAIDRSRRFFSFYVGKGSIPYGDHPAWLENHDNNGKNALAAVAFDLLDDPVATRYFSRMSTASYDEREFGHTGNYFSYLWGAPGVARAGPAAVAAHLKEQRWYFDLARRWDGGFTYQGGAGAGDSYDDWDMTGVFLLTYALPLGKLYISGKGADKANELAGAELASVIDDGRGYRYWQATECYASRSEEALLRGLASWSPVVRFRSAIALAKKEGDFVPRLVRMLGSGDPSARYGACEALEKLGSRAAPAVDALIGLLAQKDTWLQIRASYALAAVGAPARKAVPVLLELALAEDRDDPRGMLRRYLCLALFVNGYAENAPHRGLLAGSLEGVDRGLLYPAVRRMLRVEDGLARSYLASVYDNLSEEELEHLWPDILRAVKEPALSGEMFENEIRLAGLRLLARHHVREGMRICVEYARSQNPWASESRTGEIMEALKTYGAAACEVLPALRELLTFCREEQDFPEDCKRKKIAAVEDAIRTIEAAKESPPLRSLNEKGN